MDPYKLLSRSTNLSRPSAKPSHRVAPSDGPTARPQLFPSTDGLASTTLGKRKRHLGSGVLDSDKESGLRFFDKGSNTGDLFATGKPNVESETSDRQRIDAAVDTHGGEEQPRWSLSVDERKRRLKQHKVKVTWLNSSQFLKDPGKRKTRKEKEDKARAQLFPNPVQALDDLRPQYGISQVLSRNILAQGYDEPTEVQLAALPLLLDRTREHFSQLSASHVHSQIDLLTVAPTGSGKTLAFLIPLLHATISRRQREVRNEGQTSAIILAPTKELASQITNEGRKLTKGTGVTISQIRKGMELPGSPKPAPQSTAKAENAEGTIIKADIIVSTPGILQTIIGQYQDISWRIRDLIFDEADVLLDQTFREQTLAIWNSLSDPELRVSMWSATMGSNIEDLARSTISARIARLRSGNSAEVAEAPLIRLVVGLKDSAVPNVSHKLIYAATEKGKLMGLRQLLHPTSSSADNGPMLRPPFLVFTQTVERAIALNSELLYDVPVEAGGSTRIAVLHSDLSDTARDSIMTRFRQGEIWILITTDLLSRGVDFRGINGVVNYDIPTSSAAYVHRIGRTGRAGRDGGLAVTLYSKEDIPYLKHVANVVSMSQRQRGGDHGIDQWLLDALPKLSKRDKKNLKARGIESRTAKGQSNDPNAARKSRISTKSGFVRRAENNRKAAILSNRTRARPDDQSEDDGDTDFAGFD